MKKFLKFYSKDKEFVKMVNQKPTGFELVFLSDELLNDTLAFINLCEENQDTIGLIWQMKHKTKNQIHYKKCAFSAPQDNYFKKRGDTEIKPYGKKIKVTCSGSEFYTEDEYYKNNVIHYPSSFKYKRYGVKDGGPTYKDGKLLNRMLKIDNLNTKCEENESVSTKKRTKNAKGEDIYGNLNLPCEDYEDFIKTIKIKNKNE